MSKSTVINKNAIEDKIRYFYDVIAKSNKISTAEAYKTIIRVPKLAAFVADYSIQVIGLDGGDPCFEEMEQDYSVDNRMSTYIGNMFSRSNIPPTYAYINNDEKGLMLEWIPSKPLYVKSFYEYLYLYKSFIDYIENDSVGLEYWNDNEPKQTEYKICCFSLYSEYDDDEKEIKPTTETALFTKENFNSRYMFIVTHEGYFISYN